MILNKINRKSIFNTPSKLQNAITSFWKILDSKILIWKINHFFFSNTRLRWLGCYCSDILLVSWEAVIKHWHHQENTHAICPHRLKCHDFISYYYFIYKKSIQNDNTYSLPKTKFSNNDFPLPLFYIKNCTKPNLTALNWG